MYSIAEVTSTIAQVLLQAGALLMLAVILSLHRRQWRPLMIATAAVVLVAATVGMAKWVFGRGGTAGNVRALHIGGSSFPSGHTTTAVVVGSVAAWLLGRGASPAVRQLLRGVAILLRGVAILWSALIGVDRLCLNVHWLTDVLAGWSLGVGLVCLLVTAVTPPR